MLLRSVFTKTIRDLRWPTFWAGLALAVGGAYFTYLFRTYTRLFDLQSLLDALPEAARSLIGGSVIDISTATGFLNIELFPLILPAVLAGFAIAFGSGFTAGEEARGTIDVLLSYPIPRWRVILEKSAALVLAVALIGAVMLLGILVGSAAGDAPVETGNVTAGLVLAGLLALDFGAIALAIAAWTGNRGAAAGVCAALIVVMYLDQSLSAQIDVLRAVNPLSLFHYYLGGDPLRLGFNGGDAAVMAAVALAWLAISLIGFERRDLAA